MMKYWLFPRIVCFFAALLVVQFLNAQEDLDQIFTNYKEFEDSTAINSSISWPDNSEERLKHKLDGYRSIEAFLHLIVTDTLVGEQLLNYEMLNYILSDRIYRLEYESYLMPLSSEGGFITSMIYSSQSTKIKSDEKARDYIQKMKDLPRYLDQQIFLLERGIRNEKLRPKLVVDNCLDIIEDLLDDGKDDFFMIKPLRDADIEIIDELKESIYSAFSKFYIFLRDDYRKAARDKIGISENHKGNKYYQQRVRYFSSLDLSPEEVFEIGLSEVARIQSEMKEILTQLEFDGTLQDFSSFLREDEQFYAKTPEELLYYAAWLSKKAEEILPKYFNKLPRLPFTVSPVPDAIAPNYTAGRYSEGSMYSKKAGKYLVNTYKLESRPMYLLPALTLHEAVPGHHLQISLAKELKDLPSFRSSYLSAFGEGWGLYSEYLGKEAGIYTTPYEDFGRLSYEMWRACRLVIDPGIHAFDWTREQAIEYMSTHTSLSFHEIETEINRYIGWPGQAVSYKIGELKIRELRKKLEIELGKKFDIREFHDLILSNGSIPLQSLERIVNDYLNDKMNNE